MKTKYHLFLLVALLVVAMLGLVQNANAGAPSYSLFNRGSNNFVDTLNSTQAKYVAELRFANVEEDLFVRDGQVFRASKVSLVEVSGFCMTKNPTILVGVINDTIVINTETTGLGIVPFSFTTRTDTLNFYVYQTVDKFNGVICNLLINKVE